MSLCTMTRIVSFGCSWACLRRPLWALGLSLPAWAIYGVSVTAASGSTKVTTQPTGKALRQLAESKARLVIMCASVMKAWIPQIPL